MCFLELRRQCGVSHEVRQGAQGASHVAPGKSGLHVRGEGERYYSNMVRPTDAERTATEELFCYSLYPSGGRTFAIQGHMEKHQG